MVFYGTGPSSDNMVTSLLVTKPVIDMIHLAVWSIRDGTN